MLVCGLGLGITIQALLEKDNVNSITGIERELDIISLVGIYYQNMSPKVKIIHADVFSYPPSEQIYDAVWFDIWPTINSENLPQMQELKSKWQHHSKFRMCWGVDRCFKLLLEEM